MPEFLRLGLGRWNLQGLLLLDHALVRQYHELQSLIAVDADGGSAKLLGAEFIPRRDDGIVITDEILRRCCWSRLLFHRWWTHIVNL